MRSLWGSSVESSAPQPIMRKLRSLRQQQSPGPIEPGFRLPRINRGPRCAEDISVMTSSALPPNEDDEHVELDSTPVVLLLDACRISATIYLAPELGRFSEAWEAVMRDHRLFIPVTSAVVTTLTGETVGERSAFMQVRKTDIRAVSPLDYSR